VDDGQRCVGVRATFTGSIAAVAAVRLVRSCEQQRNEPHPENDKLE
jgi:hypothetical protein